MRNLNEMTTFELSRWYALYEAVNFIADECLDRKQDFNTIKLEPLYIRKYVEGTCDGFARKIEQEDEKAARIIQFQAEEAKLRESERVLHTRN